MHSGILFLNYITVLVMCLFLTEYISQKEEVVNAIKANYEKVLNTERTLKTQVKMLFLLARYQ